MTKKSDVKIQDKKKTPRKKRDWSYYVIIVSAVIIAIPLLFLGYVAISASRSSGSPVDGNRFDNDLDPAIQQTEIDTIIANVSGLDGIEAAFAELKTATLRIYILMPDASADTLKSTVSTVYGKVSEILDPEVYFTIQDSKKQYDLEIHAYNQKEVTDESRETYVYALLWKSSNMKETMTQILTTPLSQEIVDYFNRIESENAAQNENGSANDTQRDNTDDSSDGSSE